MSSPRVSVGDLSWLLCAVVVIPECRSRESVVVFLITTDPRQKPSGMTNEVWLFVVY